MSITSKAESVIHSVQMACSRAL